MENNTVLLVGKIAKVGGPIKIKPNSSKNIQDKAQVPNPLFEP